MILFGLCGPMGTGKSTVARMLSVFKSQPSIIPMAKPLKDLALSLGWNGEKDEKGRKVLQYLGTDVCRNIDEEYWLKKWIYNCEIEIDKGCNMIICDDVRYQNEYDLIKSKGGYILYLTRDGFDAGDHSSEKFVPPNYDFIIRNPREMGLIKTFESVSEIFNKVGNL